MYAQLGAELWPQVITEPQSEHDLERKVGEGADVLAFVPSRLMTGWGVIMGLFRVVGSSAGKAVRELPKPKCPAELRVLAHVNEVAASRAINHFASGGKVDGAAFSQSRQDVINVPRKRLSFLASGFDLLVLVIAKGELRVQRAR